MTVIVFETHCRSEDNEAGRATGWLPGRLSATGREQAEALGRRRRDDGLAAVFCSDLGRAVETAEVAFAGTDVPVLHDWRLRECDYGDWNGAPVAQVHGDRASYLDTPYPGGESWRQAVERHGLFLRDLPLRWAGTRVLVIGHGATWDAMDHFLGGVSVDERFADPRPWLEKWEGMEYELPG